MIVLEANKSPMNCLSMIKLLMLYLKNLLRKISTLSKLYFLCYRKIKNKLFCGTPCTKKVVGVGAKWVWKQSCQIYLWCNENTECNLGHAGILQLGVVVALSQRAESFISNL